MSNDLQASFDYGLVTIEEANMLKTAEMEIGFHLGQMGNHAIAIGHKLIEVKESLNGKGETFVEWCNKSDLGFTYKRATEYIAVAREFGEIRYSGFFGKNGPGHRAISSIAQLKDKELQAALVEYTKEQIDSGKKVSQSETLHLLSELKAAKAQAEQMAESQFDANAKLVELREQLVKAKEREKQEREKKDQYARDLIEQDAKRKQLEAAYRAEVKAKQQALQDAEEVHREHLAEMRRQIAAEERARPRTDAEEVAHQARLKELQDEASKAQTALNQATKAKADLERDLLDMRKEVALRDQVLTDWGTASIGFREVALRLAGSADGLKRIPLTDELYSQVKMIRELALSVVNALDGVTNVG